jgi:hypothetical protein
MKFKNTLIAATLLLSITSAQAALVESDWKNTGDALATLDTSTGIEWLDLTQTDNMSINQAEGLTGAGGVFEGWRLPTLTEVTEMMVNAFPRHSAPIESDFSSYYDFNDATTDNEVVSFRSLFGTTQTTSSDLYARGMYKNDPGQSKLVVFSGARERTYNQDTSIYINRDVTDDYNYIGPHHGVYLVSDGGTTLSSQLDPSININNAAAPINDVSAPALLGLMGLGLFGFAARRSIS